MAVPLIRGMASLIRGAGGKMKSAGEWALDKANPISKDAISSIDDVARGDLAGFYKKQGLIGIGTNVLMPGYFAVDTYQQGRQNGNGVVTSAMAAAGEFAMGFVMNPVAYMAASVLPSLPGMAVDGYETLNQYNRNLQRQNRNIPFANATFLDNQQTYTMRQAGMNLARQGQFAAAQSTLGNEASSVSYMGVR